jgi:hypothetical protein
MKQRRIPLQEAAGVLGDADKSQTYGRYGKMFDPKALVRAVQAIDYGLDLAPLKDPRVNPDFARPKKRRHKKKTPKS